MRRFMSLSLESVSYREADVLSLEEEQIVMSEAVDLSNEITQELNESERNIEISDALEDLAVIADQIEQASPVEIALIETVGDVAVAGTDIEAERVVPSMESYRGGRIATEGLYKTATTVWENIQKYIATVWEKINKFFYNIFGVIPRIRKSLDEILEKAKEADLNKSPAGTVIELSTPSIAKHLTINGKLPTKDNDVTHQLARMVNFAEYIYGANLISLSKLGNGIAAQMEKVDMTGTLLKFSSSIEEAGKEVVRLSVEYFRDHGFPKGESSTKSESGGFTIHTMVPMLGGARLVAKNFNQASGDAGTLANQLERIRHSGVIFDNSSVSAPPKGSYQLPILSKKAIQEMVKEINKLLDTLEEYKRGAASKQVEATRKKLESASSRGLSAAKNVDDSNGGDDVMATMKGVLNFNVAYARWASNPAVDFSKYAINTINGVIAYMNKSIQAYQ